MKKLLLTAVLIGTSACAFGQGWVQFRNFYAGTSPAVDAPVRLLSPTGQLLDSSNNLWRAALIGGPTTGTAASLSTAGTLQMMFYPTTAATSTISWVNFRSGTTPPAAPGYVAYGSSVPRAVPGVDWGGTALVQMVAWQGNYTDWASAWDAANRGVADVLIGFSNPLTLKLPSSSTDPNFTYLWGLNSFFIAPIPEPTTFALAGLGAAALLIFRRRS